MKSDSVQIVGTVSRRDCQRVVQALMERYDWALLQDDDLVESVLSLAPAAASPADLERLAKNRYTIALYEACRQAEEPARRERGYYELSRFLFRAACNRWPDLAEDVTQRALLLVCEQIDRCRNPGAFLSFALYKLRHASQQGQRERDRELPLEEMYQVNEARDQTASPPELLYRRERLQALLDAVRRLPDERQRQTILSKFFEGLSDEATAARLGVTAGHVRVLRHRGIARLREDEQLGDYFAEEIARRDER
ncbi:MAG: sigma-70 family RNA polymerase sigma factor [Chloroflexota bacterium]|nr:sigma-70 family RNA polymerase sigma factor [Chloroflexota bacterium]